MQIHVYVYNISGICIISKQGGNESQIEDLKILFKYKLSMTNAIFTKKKLLRLNFRCQYFIHIVNQLKFCV